MREGKRFYETRERKEKGWREGEKTGMKGEVKEGEGKDE